MKNKLVVGILIPTLIILMSCSSQQTNDESDKMDTTAINQEETDQTVKSDDEWVPLFDEDLSNARAPEGIWTFEDSVLTASEDQNIWTLKEFDNFVLDLEFKTAEGTNSGVIVYCSDRDNWIPNSIEVQIADDYDEEWANAPGNWQCGAIFGHKAPTKSMVKKPGEWNHYKITCADHRIIVELNGEMVNEMDMRKYTSAETNPDGSEIPEWLSKPLSELPTQGYVGLQGKHAGAPIYFRNLRIRELE